LLKAPQFKVAQKENQMVDKGFEPQDPSEHALEVIDVFSPRISGMELSWQKPAVRDASAALVRVINQEPPRPDPDAQS